MPVTQRTNTLGSLYCVAADRRNIALCDHHSRRLHLRSTAQKCRLSPATATTATTWREVDAEARERVGKNNERHGDPGLHLVVSFAGHGGQVALVVVQNPACGLTLQEQAKPNCIGSSQPALHPTFIR